MPQKQMCVVCKGQWCGHMFVLQIPKLTEGREYVMRISAENMYGISDPLESEEMRAKDLFSMFSTHTPFTDNSKILLTTSVQTFEFLETPKMK